MAASVREALAAPAARAVCRPNSRVDQGFHPEEILLDPMDAVRAPQHEPLDDLQVGTVPGEIPPGLEVELVRLSPADEGLVVDLRKRDELATGFEEKAIRTLRHSGRRGVEDVVQDEQAPFGDDRSGEAQIAQDAGGRVVAVDADGAGPLCPRSARVASAVRSAESISWK